MSSVSVGKSGGNHTHPEPTTSRLHCCCCQPVKGPDPATRRRPARQLHAAPHKMVDDLKQLGNYMSRCFDCTAQGCQKVGHPWVTKVTIILCNAPRPSDALRRVNDSYCVASTYPPRIAPPRPAACWPFLPTRPRGYCLAHTAFLPILCLAGSLSESLALCLISPAVCELHENRDFACFDQNYTFSTWLVLNTQQVVCKYFFEWVNSQM